MRVCTLCLAAFCWALIAAIAFLTRGDDALSVIACMCCLGFAALAGITWPVDPLDVDEYMGEASER